MTKKHTQLFAILAFITVFLGISIIYYFLADYYGGGEAVQKAIQSTGNWGLIIYFLWGLTSVVITPLNFSIAGMAGGYIYGTIPAFLINWLCKSIGSFISYYIGKHYGRTMLKYLIEEKKMAAYDKFIRSEKAAILYFGLSFIPYTPSDNLPYLLGAAKLNKRIFIPITIVGTIGTSFGTAYIGSGAAFNNLPFLSIFIIAFFLGMYWIHASKKHFNLD